MRTTLVVVVPIFLVIFQNMSFYGQGCNISNFLNVFVTGLGADPRFLPHLIAPLNTVDILIVGSHFKSSLQII